MNKTKHQDFVLKAVQFIEANLTNPIKVDDVCQQIPLSSWQFQRVFRFLLKTSVGSYLRGRRLTEAFKILLQENKSKIVDLAFEFQFDSHDGFTRSFKEYFGCLPSEAKNNENLFQAKKNLGLDETRLAAIWSIVQDILIISEIASQNLCGISREVNSPFSNKDEFENNTGILWNDFLLETQRAQKSQTFSTMAVGISLNSLDQLISDKMNYFACKERSEFEIPPAHFSNFQLPSGQYGQFLIRGDLSQVQTLVDYIYGIWLPSSGFVRARGYEWEKFDFKTTRQNGLFGYQYNIPLEKK